MNAELKKEWTAALRSGQYEQGIGILRNGDKYCCLGVLGDLLVKKPDAQSKWNHEGYYTRLIDLDGTTSTYMLNGRIAEQTGLSDEYQVELGRMNDEEGKSFAEIADFIDAHL